MSTPADDPSPEAADQPTGAGRREVASLVHALAEVSTAPVSDVEPALARLLAAITGALDIQRSCICLIDGVDGDGQPYISGFVSRGDEATTALGPALLGRRLGDIPEWYPNPGDRPTSRVYHAASLSPVLRSAVERTGSHWIETYAIDDGARPVAALSLLSVGERSSLAPHAELDGLLDAVVEVLSVALAHRRIDPATQHPVSGLQQEYRTATERLHRLAEALDEAINRLEGRAAADTGDAAIALTARESEVLQLLRSGHRVRGVADVLGIQPETVRSHLKSLFRKVGVRSQTELLLKTAPNAAGGARQRS